MDSDASDPRRPDETVSGAGPLESADERMAEILADGGTGDEPISRAGLRRELRDEGSPHSEDLLGRLNALDFVDSLVGGVGGEIPERLGDYRITGMLGRGGMGTVYEAFQESLERTVALKVLSPSFAADVRMRQRFRSEARATASLHHQHIVPIYGYGEAAGYLYFTMEKVEGVSLDKLISAHIGRRDNRETDGIGPLSPIEAARRFVGVADALAHAHRRRLLHRDVKPGNILVHADGTLALADFGLSKMLDAVSRSLTGGAFLGTLHYTAPEQAKGAPLTEASDLYSLGVTLFETITGQLPLRGKTTEAMLQAVLNGTPHRLREVLPTAPRDLDAVLAKLLEKEPEDRYRDGEELAGDLRRVAEGEPIRIRRQSLFVRLWRRARKNPVLTSAVVAAVLLTALVLYLTLDNLEQRQRTARSGYENRLGEALVAMARSAGDPFGPASAFRWLTGVDKPTVEPDRMVTEPLAAARKLWPEDPRAPELEAAYLKDPSAAASALIAQGDAPGALAVLDPEIEQARRGYLSGQDATLVRLYRLYLLRGAVRLSAAVGRLDDAARDFYAASWIRSGAKWPQMVLAVIDWRRERGVDALVAAVGRALGADPRPQDRQAVGHLLRAVAGIRRGSDCQLMRIDLGFAERRALDAFADELLGAGVEGAQSTGSWTGLERELAAVGTRVLSVLSAGAEVDRLVSSAIGALSARVLPDAPLQSWSLVFRILQQQDAGPRVRQGVVLTPRQEVLGWLDLLRLEPPARFLRTQATALRAARDRAASAGVSRGLLTELEARQAMATSFDPTAAINRWFAEDADHPEVAWFRFLDSLRDAKVGSVDESAVLEVGTRAAIAWQKSVDQPTTAASIVRELQTAAERSGGQDAERWRKLLADFVPLAEVPK